MTRNDGLVYGPMLIGVFLNCMLYGAMAVQAHVYFQTYKSDKWWFKLFVYYLLFCETLNTLFDIGVVFEPLVIRYGSPQVFVVAPTMLPTNPLLTVMISLPVQLFIAWRVKIMSGSSVLPAIISLLAVSSFVGGVATTVSVVLINLEYSRFPDNDGAVITWLASSAVADAVISASLVYSLLRKRTGFAATDDVINKIIWLTVQTGLLTATCALLDVTLFLLLKGGTWNYIMDLALSKLYSNTILSTLNSRRGWKATSTIHDNVLFGKGSGVESAARSRTQIETVTTVTINRDLQGRKTSSAVPMKVFNAGAGYDHEDSTSEINVVSGFV